MAESDDPLTPDPPPASVIPIARPAPPPVVLPPAVTVPVTPPVARLPVLQSGAFPPLTPEQMVRLTAARNATQELLAREQEKFLQLIQKRRSDLASHIEVKRGRLQEHVAQLRAPEARSVLIRFDVAVDAANEAAVDQMGVLVHRLSVLLERIDARVTVLRTRGVVTTAVDRAIRGSYDALAAARVAIVEQAGRTYEVRRVDAASVRVELQRLRTTIAADLTGVRARVVVARNMVQRALDAMSVLPGIDDAP